LLSSHGAILACMQSRPRLMQPTRVRSHLFALPACQCRCSASPCRFPPSRTISALRRASPKRSFRRVQPPLQLCPDASLTTMLQACRLPFSWPSKIDLSSRPPPFLPPPTSCWPTEWNCAVTDLTLAVDDDIEPFLRRIDGERLTRLHLQTMADQDPSQFLIPSLLPALKTLLSDNSDTFDNAAVACPL
jgi:hypothetical protein